MTEELSSIDRDLDRALSEWTAALVENLNDPATAAQMELLGADHRLLIRAFLENRALPDPLTEEFVRMIRQLLSGLSKVVLTGREIRVALASGGLPATLDETKKRFADHLAQKAQGLDPTKVRIVLGGPQ